jgi:hypothetical protein
MVYIEIGKKNDNLIDKLNKHLMRKNDKIFMLVYMEGCGPCNQTRPEWSKLRNVLSNQFLNREDIAIVSINKDFTNLLKNMKSEPTSFPTITFITDAGKQVEAYEDSSVSNKDRSIDSFVEWIKLKSGEPNITKSEILVSKPKSKSKTSKFLHGGKTRRRKHHGGKWSAKYKRSINCNRPKGFSQKQYCKYGRNK